MSAAAGTLQLSEASIPQQILALAPREREVATIVYGQGASTAKDVESCLSADLTNGAVRSMLCRLVAKGVLKRRWGSRGRGHQFIYMPALTAEDVKRKALRMLADRYFEGSLLGVARTALSLVEHDPVEAPGTSRTGAPSLRVDLAA